MKCDFCEKEGSSLIHLNEGAMCPLCEIMIYGKTQHSGNSSYDRYWTDGDIVLWIKDPVDDTDIKIVGAWFQDGRESIPLSALDREMSIEDTIIFLKKFKKDSFWFCSNCGKVLKENDIDHKHFAGNYCKECSEKYRKENNRKCRMCGKPEHSCYC